MGNILKNIKHYLDKNPLAKNVLSALAVAFFGYLLLDITFIFDVIYQGVIRWIIGLFIPLGPDMDIFWFPPLMHFSFVIVIGIISWFVFRSKLDILYKAIFMTVPLAVVLATIGMFSYHLPIVAYSLGLLFCLGVLYYLYKTKQHWLYYYTLILMGIAMLLLVLLGVEI